VSAVPAYMPCRTSATVVEPPAIVQTLDPRARSVSVLLSAESPAIRLLREGVSHIMALSVLPVDPEADAAFATFSRSLIKKIPRQVIRRK
jgi:hypothetical protein